jgi:NADH-quinone oxidoreductase subunit N
MMPNIDFRLISPEIFLTLWAFGVLFVDLFIWRREDRRQELLWLSLVGLVATLGLVFWAGQGETFDGALHVDAFAFLFQIICLGSAIFTVMLCSGLSNEIQGHRGEFYALLMFSTVGMLFLVAAHEILTLYVSLELVTIPLFVLVAYSKTDRRSIEGGLKYLVIGGFSSAILLFGLALLYGLAGSTDLLEIKKHLLTAFFRDGVVGPALPLALLFVIAGLGFKLAVVPFHAWAPDVYEGAPTPVVAFLSVASKAAGLAVFTRIFYRAFSMSTADWLGPLMILAVLAMILGNTVAITQKNIKRLLAYSSIAQVGYILVGFSAMSVLGASSIGFYLLVYLFANMGAFGVALAVYHKIGSYEISDYSSLSSRSPQLAAIMAICLLSLTGIPPLAGFFGKYYLFLAAIEQRLYWLVIVALLTSVVSLYYYANIIRVMYFDKSAEEASRLDVPPMMRAALWLATAGLIVGGIFPNLFLGWAEAAATVFKF